LRGRGAVNSCYPGVVALGTRWDQLGDCDIDNQQVKKQASNLVIGTAGKRTRQALNNGGNDFIFLFSAKITMMGKWKEGEHQRTMFSVPVTFVKSRLQIAPTNTESSFKSVKRDTASILPLQVLESSLSSSIL
jgi:hypothetical protein